MSFKFKDGDYVRDKYGKVSQVIGTDWDWFEVKEISSGETYLIHNDRGFTKVRKPASLKHQLSVLRDKTYRELISNYEKPWLFRKILVAHCQKERALIARHS